MWIKRFIFALVVLAGLVAVYFWLAVKWSYSSGERAGWIQKDAAAALGISSRVMNYKVKKYNFKNPRWNRNRPGEVPN